MDTLDRIEGEIQDLIYHLEELKSGNGAFISAHINGLISSANYIADYAEGLTAEDIAEYVTELTA